MNTSGEQWERPSSPRRVGGFTLLEVVLALSIAFGLLVVVLFFYQQATRLRESTLGASTGLAAIRLCMDRLATELRTASQEPGAFRGGPQEIEFQHCEFPDPGFGTATAPAMGRPPGLLLRRVRYAMEVADSASGTGIFTRTEEAVQSLPTPPADSLAEAADEVPDNLTATNEVMALEPEIPDSETTRLTTALASSSTARLAVPEVRFLRLRYFDGTSWQDSWNASGPPRGVEVTLALESAPDEGATEALPNEVFRRVIALPLGTGTAPAGAEDNLEGFPEVAKHLPPEERP